MVIDGGQYNYGAGFPAWIQTGSAKKNLYMGRRLNRDTGFSDTMFLTGAGFFWCNLV